jgi:hypothetical protein
LEYYRVIDERIAEVQRDVKRIIRMLPSACWLWGTPVGCGAVTSNTATKRLINRIGKLTEYFAFPRQACAE